MSDTQVTLASGHEGTVRDQFNSYIRRLKGGEMGSVPAIFGILVLTIVFQVLSPFFITKLNFVNLFVQSAELMMLSAALVFVILLAEIDLAAGVTAGVAMAIFIVLVKSAAWPWIPAMIVAFLAGMAIGAFIGYMVAKIGVPSFVVSLAFFLGFQGMQLVLLGEGGVYRVEVPTVLAVMNKNLTEIGGWILLIICTAASYLISLWDRRRRTQTGLQNKPFSIVLMKLGALVILGSVSVYYMNLNRSQGAIPIKGVPIVIPITIAILAIGTFVLDRTRFGRHLYAVGGNLSLIHI
jgi:D-xylose transport system permease protein